jgi:expansin (peptidoglycan-binding protein)
MSSFNLHSCWGLLLLITVGCDSSDDSVSPDASDASLQLDAGRPKNQTDAFSNVDAGNHRDAGGRDVETGVCTACDSVEASNPSVDAFGGTGNVTTYGSVIDPAPSRGGACNYGATEIKYFAAINVNVESGDGLGQWRGGKICGQCALVRAKTPEGWKEVVLRIVDKCADQYCGIDLGGAPARDLMGSQPGRYDGTWKFISCQGYPNVSDGSPSIFVKEGSNPWWALIQVRNPPAAVESIEWETADGKKSGTFSFATEAENFYSVPEEVRASTETIHITVRYTDGTTHNLDITGSALTQAQASYPL